MRVCIASTATMTPLYSHSPRKMCTSSMTKKISLILAPISASKNITAIANTGDKSAINHSVNSIRMAAPACSQWTGTSSWGKNRKNTHPSRCGKRKPLTMSTETGRRYLRRMAIRIRMTKKRTNRSKATPANKKLWHSKTDMQKIWLIKAYSKSSTRMRRTKIPNRPTKSIEIIRANRRRRRIVISRKLARTKAKAITGHNNRRRYQVRASYTRSGCRYARMKWAGWRKGRSRRLRPGRGPPLAPITRRQARRSSAAKGRVNNVGVVFLKSEHFAWF